MVFNAPSLEQPMDILFEFKRETYIYKFIVYYLPKEPRNLSSEMRPVDL